MGKNRTIKIIADLIAGMVAHKILLRYTNKPESINHMQSEINNYRGTITDFSEEFNWNEDDKITIKQETIKSIKNELNRSHFNDVKFPENEPEKLIDKILKEMIG